MAQSGGESVTAESFYRLRGSRKQTNQTLPDVHVALIQDLAGNECHLLVWMAMHRPNSACCRPADIFLT